MRILSSVLYLSLAGIAFSLKAQELIPRDKAELQFQECGVYKLYGRLSCKKNQCTLTLNPDTRSSLVVEIQHPNPSFLQDHFENEWVEVEAKLNKIKTDQSHLKFKMTRISPKKIYKPELNQLIEEDPCEP